MKLIVFGATGMMGKQLVQQALYKGWEVKAFGRNVYTTDYLEAGKLELVQGALFDATEVLKAIQGIDAVVSALGGGFDGTDKTRSLGMKNIIAQMEKAGIKRIIGIGGMGILDNGTGKMLFETEGFPPEYLGVSQEHKTAYELLKASALEWTFVCPPNISNALPNGVFQTAAEVSPEPDNYRINSGDLALFMLNELEKNEYLKMRVGISN